MTSYKELLKELSAAHVRYLIVGGVAVNFTGYQYQTSDLDILPDLETENLEKVVRIMKSQGYTPRVPVDPHELLDPTKRKEWEEKRNMKAFCYINLKDKTAGPVDFLIMSAYPFQDFFNRKKIIEIDGTPIYVAGIDDLIEMKKKAGRTKDLYVIKILEKIKERDDGTT